MLLSVRSYSWLKKHIMEVEAGHLLDLKYRG